MKQRILHGFKGLLDSQFTLAKGCSYLYRIEKDEKGQKKKPELITNQATIEQYLNGEFDDDQDEFYFITTERPDNKAIDSLLDRVFGKARQTLGLDGGLDEDNKPIPLMDGITKK
ncbi:MAG: hypothetical protein AB9866_19115 [Syntrophobacteraceae bacterium]